MIGIEGQFVFIFSIDNKKDFINTLELETFKIIEEAGNVLPIFNLTFKSSDEEVIQYFNEGATIRVSFGKNQASLSDISLMITKRQSSRLGYQERRFILNGIMAKVPYIVNPGLQITADQTSVETVQQIVSKYFKSRIEASSYDEQKWVQYNIPDKHFVNQIVTHMNIPNSFPIFGITSKGEFLIKDFSKVVKQKYRYRFNNLLENRKKDILYDSDYIFTNESGFLNALIGYGREKQVFNIETGTSDVESQDVTPILALSSKLSRRADIEARFAEVGVINSNVHPNYWRAALRNLMSWMIFSEEHLLVRFTGIFKPIQILDLVMFKEDQTQGDSRVASEAVSGLYVVDKVVRTLSGNKFLTIVGMSRECMNKIKGLNR